jgi:hypothetical protein
LRSKNDSLNEENKNNFYKSKFDRLEAISDDEELKMGQVDSLEMQRLLASKLENLEEYHSGMQSEDYGSAKKNANQEGNFSCSSIFCSSGDKSPSSSTLTPHNITNFQYMPNINIHTSAKSSSIINCSTDGQEEACDLQSPETKTCLLQKLYALKEEHQMYESDNSDEEEKSPT